MNLNRYLEQWIVSMARTVSRYYLKDARGRRFITALIPALGKSAGVRKTYAVRGIHIPPFLIASITSRCNLHCTGCYAMAKECAGTAFPADMTTGEWRRIFQEAADIGVSFILLAGGEPLMRRDVLSLAASFPGMVFPTFTNATLVDESYLQFFDEHRNLIPIPSIEGSSEETDRRRRTGISQKVLAVMEEFQSRGMLYGVSITVTAENIRNVTSDTFVADLRKAGCGIVMYLEYVPAEQGTGHLVLSDSDTALLEARVTSLRSGYPDMILLSFPGDESVLGGCLAAGRGFFHISPSGNAEPCPFSPYSQQCLKSSSVLDVLQSPFFRNIQEISMREAGV
ncbi:MAG: radical SAM protein, partial [Methanocalculaceae archaeon]|nr:radical SAM protein [Methanocalculaceae archaeon]